MTLHRFFLNKYSIYIRILYLEKFDGFIKKVKSVAMETTGNFTGNNDYMFYSYYTFIKRKILKKKKRELDRSLYSA